MTAARVDPQDGGIRRLEWPRGWQGAAWATVFYTVLTIGWTWPLVTAMRRSLPWDMGDPVLNTWILRWTSEHLTALAAGALVGVARLVEPDVLPSGSARTRVLGASRRASAAGAAGTPRNRQRDPLLQRLAAVDVRAVGAWGVSPGARSHPQHAAAFLAGVFFAFTPYRIAQLSHLQVLSAEWMPFALYAIRRHLQTGSRRSIVGFVASVVLQNLSCGYYLVYFFPFLALWIAGEITARGRRRDRALLQRLAVAGVSIVALTTPFLVPYYRLRQLGFTARTLDEVRFYSADVTAYWTTYPTQWLWGSALRASPRPENELFPGLVLIVLAAVGVAVMVSRVANGVASHGLPDGGAASRWSPGFAAVAAIVMTVVHWRVAAGSGSATFKRFVCPSSSPSSRLAPVVLAAVSTSFRTAALAALQACRDLAGTGCARRPSSFHSVRRSTATACR